MSEEEATTTTAGEGAPSPSSTPPVQQQQVHPAVRYREVVAECNQLMTKVADLESDLVEHSLVEDTLQPLDGGRRAYRLVGDVLVERSVAEILPSITKNKENVRACVHAYVLHNMQCSVCNVLLGGEGEREMYLV